MKLILFFFLFIPLVSAIEVSELDNYVIVKNNREMNATYTVLSENKETFSLMPEETEILMPGNYEIQEDIGTNLIASVYVGSRSKKDYGDLKVILISLSISFIVSLLMKIFKKYYQFMLKFQNRLKIFQFFRRYFGFFLGMHIKPKKRNILHVPAAKTKLYK